MYNFNIVGVSSMLCFFKHQQEASEDPHKTGVAYISSYQCTLDALIQSVEYTPLDQDWNLDQAIQSVIQFWMSNLESVKHWQSRLHDAGKDSILVSRIADQRSLRHELEMLFHESR
jgi:hypothetical protein